MVRWPDVTEVVAQAAAVDAVLEGIYGEAIRHMGAAKFRVPSLEYMLVSEVYTGDIWSPSVIQWDQRVLTMEALIASERALMRLFDLGDQDVTLIGGLPMWAQYAEGEGLLGPDRPGYFARAVRFRFTPVRQRYAPTL